MELSVDSLSSCSSHWAMHFFSYNFVWVCLGTLHTGIGLTEANAFLSTVNLPPVDHKLLKRYEREIGCAVESVAKKIFEAALQEECCLRAAPL